MIACASESVGQECGVGQRYVGGRLSQMVMEGESVSNAKRVDGEDAPHEEDVGQDKSVVT
jgi:hypothetical protein